MTLPVIHLRAHGGPRAEVVLRRVLDAREVTLEDWREIRALLAQTRAIEHARRTAEEYVGRAKEALCAFPSSEARDALLFLPDYVMTRDK